MSADSNPIPNRLAMISVVATIPAPPVAAPIKATAEATNANVTKLIPAEIPSAVTQAGLGRGFSGWSFPVSKNFV